MKFSMVVLAVLCIFLGLLSPWILKSAEYTLSELTRFPIRQIRDELASASTVLLNIVFSSIIFAALLSCLAVFRRLLLKGRCIRQTVTWDCGYARPGIRMQYTAASFAQPLTNLFRLFLQIRKKNSPPEGIFPARSSLHTDTGDSGEMYLYLPLFRWIRDLLVRLQWLQHGRLQIYILYIALTLWFLLIWKLI